MILDMSAILLDLDGKPILLDAEPLTLGRACVRALSTLFDGEDGATKTRRFELAMDLHGGKHVELSAEDVTELKLVTGRIWNPVVVGRIYGLLDPLQRKSRVLEAREEVS